MLNISSITIRVAGRVLIGQGSAVIHEGHKVALIGRNGTGKSTLLKAIAGEIGIDSGSIDLPSRYSMGMTRQEAPSGSQNLLDTVLATDLERVKLMKAAEEATDPQEIADIHERLEIIGASSAPSRAARILAGLGFGEEAQNRPCDSFSGGWRMRVALASLLFTQPDLLLLDEPTNHLDLEATMWLEDYLRRYPGTIIIVSHDRGLLNRVPEQIIHLNNQSLTSYKGNFDRFQRTRAERLELDAKSATKQEKKRQHLQSFVDRFRAKASKATQAQSRLKMLEKMTPIAVEHDEMAPTLSFADPGSLAPPMYSLENVSIGYGETVILKNVGLRLDPEDRVALLGANGNGKSTLMKMFAGRLPIMDGSIHRDSKIRVGYFAQHQADELPMGLTPIEAMLEREPKLAPP
ncbi:MAG: ABC-F family ATP-binding cassette domain-containing protein, partial [Alphaproteobacteria bacterium]